MNEDFGALAGLGVGMVIFGLVLYLGLIALMIWIGYLIMRTAVKNGILKADEERMMRGYGPGGQSPQGYQPPGPGGAQPPTYP